MPGILDEIDAPTDLKALGCGELTQMYFESRELLVSRVTENGGHLASNLGIIELTIHLASSI